MQFGYIGFGEAAFEISKGLKKAGMNTIFAYDAQQDHPVYGKLVNERATESAVVLLDSAEKVLESVNIIITAVPANKTFDVYEAIKQFLTKDHVYIDLTAASPNVKQTISDDLKDTGATFVDAAIMGPVRVYGHQVPILFSGEETHALIHQLRKYGMNIESVGPKPGSASAIKLIRSIYMKGISALQIELLEAAKKFNVEDAVIDSISETLDNKSFKETMNRLVTGTAIHAERRSKELEGTIEMLKASNLDFKMSEAAKLKLEAVSHTGIKESFKGEVPPSWTDVISVLNSTKINN